MTTADDNRWVEANQRYLVAAVAQIRAALERHRATASGEQVQPDEVRTVGGANDDLQALREALPAPAALDRICEAFGLSPFERAVLLLCAGMELDGGFAALCAAAQGDARRPYPTFGLALAALPQPHWSALVPPAPLRHWRLVEVGAGDALTTSRLRIDERILHALAGVQHLDDRLTGLVEPITDARELWPAQAELAARITSVWTGANGPQVPAVQLHGGDALRRQAVAAAAAQSCCLRLHVLRATDVPTAATERGALVRLWERETVLGDAALLLDCDALDAGTPAEQAVRALIEDLPSWLVVASGEPLPRVRRPSLVIEVRPPSFAEQEQVWRRALGPAARRLNGEIDAIAGQFHLGAQAIETIGEAMRAGDDEGGDMGNRLWETCRRQASPRLEDLAQRIEPVATWDDLVLPEVPRTLLHEIAAQVRQRVRVYERWGFAARGRRGLGISALFAGPSGTGKTLAAEVLANELRLDLFRIDLSRVVSKYIGETEKNLRRVFDAAEEGGAILLFDEADAVFGKRSEVKDSHDRYANIEISYLLQRMESYQGLAILTTNMKSALDPAFLRRLRFVVQFPFPDAAQRRDIWRRMFPSATPTEDLDLERLAKLNIAGGNIRNIALNAAFLAADASEPVRMAHLLRAARGEYAKLERPLTEAEMGGGR